MTKISVFPLIENLLKEDILVYGFVPPEARTPYVVYDEISQSWSFPDVTRGTITFNLRAVSTYKGAQEITQMTALLKQKLEGQEVSMEPHGKGLFRFVGQENELKKDAITRESLLEFQVLCGDKQ